MVIGPPGKQVSSTLFNFLGYAQAQEAPVLVYYYMLCERHALYLNEYIFHV